MGLHLAHWDSLFDPHVAPALGMSLELLDAHTARMRQLGYRAGGAARSAITWAVARLATWFGDPGLRHGSPMRICAHSPAEIDGCCRRPDVGFIARR